MATVIDVPLSGLEAALDRTERKIRRAIARGALAGAHRGRAVAVRATPVDLGPMKASWKVNPGTADFEGDLDGVLATLVNDSPHIAAVELGSRPHGMSPAGWTAIYEWVRRHYRGKKLGGKGRMRPPRETTVTTRPYHGEDPVISEVTNAIVHRIATKGTPARLFVKNALPEIRRVMIAELERALATAESRPE
jgi:hypothetical protein